MSWRVVFFSKLASLRQSQTLTTTAGAGAATILRPSALPNPNPSLSFSTSFLVTKTPKKFRKKRKKKPSARSTPVQTDPNRVAALERVVERDKSHRFLIRSKQYLSKQPEHVVLLADTGKLYRELGFPRGRKVNRFVKQHPLIFQYYRHSDDKLWLGFTDLMEELLEEENRIMDSRELDRVHKVCKLLMMSAGHRIPSSKLDRCRLLFGLPDDFRDRAEKYPELLRVTEGGRVLELANWDPSLAVSSLEREFITDEDKVKLAFRFKVKHGRDLELDVDEQRRLAQANTLPLVSPYSDGSKVEPRSLDAEKYRVGVLHEFLSLTLEKRALIHHIVEFRKELSLTGDTYHMLRRQPRSFYLAGTQMNWAVFLRDAYDKSTGELIEKDPQLVFNEKLYRIAWMKKMTQDGCSPLTETP